MEISLFLKKKIHIIRVIKYVNRLMALPSMNLNLNFIFLFFFLFKPRRYEMGC